MKCSTTRKIIDQADDPASLPYQTAAHVEGCSSCRQFASEREQLRKLLLEPRRVSAPANFEAVIARRLAQQRGSRPVRVGIGFYLRTGGAAAALACLVLIVQMARLNPVSRMPAPSRDDRIAVSTTPATNENKGIDNVLAAPPALAVVRTPLPVRPGKPRGSQVKVKPEPGLAIADMTAQPRAIILLRNSGSEQEIAVPMVSVGAQQWLPVSVRSQDERVRMTF